jgi:hypothetical protein
MNTFRYLWVCSLAPSEIRYSQLLFNNFAFFSSLREEVSNKMTTTLSMFFLYSFPATSKYTLLDEKILQNEWLTSAQKNEFFNIFSGIQRQYFAFSRLAYLWKWKRARVSIETDLFLTPIERQKPNCFVLYQGKNKFCFVIADLIRIMEIAVWHKWEACFRVTPHSPANPYTKQEFRKVDLYNIYFHMKWKMNIVIPVFLHLWFQEEFCLGTFARKNDQYIRKMCIRQYTRNTSNQNQMLYRNVKEMLSDHYACKWRIHEDFPREILVDAMRPYLYIHYLVTFDIVSFRQASYLEIILHRELLRFYNFNKAFGRKSYIITKQFNSNKLVQKTEVFQAETPGFFSWNL